MQLCHLGARLSQHMLVMSDDMRCVRCAATPRHLSGRSAPQRAGHEPAAQARNLASWPQTPLPACPVPTPGFPAHLRRAQVQQGLWVDPLATPKTAAS